VIRQLGIAVLTFPDVASEWSLADATTIAPGKYDKLALGRRSLRTWQRKVNSQFPHVVAANSENARLGTYRLKRAYVAMQVAIPTRAK
jgi:hypothetical protein